MAKLLFRLRNVPESEAQLIRELLDENNFDWYETTAGNWGIAVAAIWLSDNEQWDEARACIDKLQAELGAKSRLDYELQMQRGDSETIFSLFLRNPLLYLLALAGICLIAWFSIHPFFGLLAE